MMDPERVKQLIAEGLPCEGLHVQGDGQHFEALIVSAQSQAYTVSPDSETFMRFVPRPQ